MNREAVAGLVVVSLLVGGAIGYGLRQPEDRVVTRTEAVTDTETVTDTVEVAPSSCKQAIGEMRRLIVQLAKAWQIASESAAAAASGNDVKAITLGLKSNQLGSDASDASDSASAEADECLAA